MDVNNEFRTMKGYQITENPEITNAMEDYLEMICRILLEKEVVRVSELSQKLNVNPSSTTKMVQQLCDVGLITAKKYGYINTTAKGNLLGEYLLYRHSVINSFLCKLNGTEDELEQTEKIEHFLNEATIRNLEAATHKL